MSRMKWNLDLLEEVKNQHDEALISTEHVVNRVRSDLFSMTEEVWEGEDADIARDQLHELSFKEMPDTYDQIDTCNNVIQKAQKEAYESKNFCNDFPQIFSNGSMPSDGNQSRCTGDLMRDEDSCEGLKSSMKAAGENARNVHSAISSVESILASLETDFAKFDYSSYTQPIKEQTQKVAERTEMYNTAVTRYEHKTKELDHTLSNALKLATPDFVPAPLDPSCLGIGDEIHFGDSKITGSLEEYITAKIDGELDEAQIKDILSMLFDKENVDISEYSEEDFGMAFIKLSEEKKRAMLMEMGYSKEQIDSILDSCKGNKAVAVGNSIGRTLIEKIADKEGNKHGRLKTGKGSTLGLAGIKGPGQFNTDFAKTDADAYDVAGGSKTKTGGNTGKNSGSSSTGNNSGSSSTGSNPNPGGGGSTATVSTEQVQQWIDENDTEAIQTYVDSVSENYDEWEYNTADNLALIMDYAASNINSADGNTNDIYIDILDSIAEHLVENECINHSLQKGDARYIYDTRTYAITYNSDAIDAIQKSMEKFGLDEGKGGSIINEFKEYADSGITVTKKCTYITHKNASDKELSDENILKDSSRVWEPLAGPDDIESLYVHEVTVSKDGTINFIYGYHTWNIYSTDTITISSCSNNRAYVEYTEDDFSCASNAYLPAEKWDYYETFIEENGTEADKIFFEKIRDGEYGWALENVDHTQLSDAINVFLADYSNAMMQQDPDEFLVYVNAISLQDGEWGTSGTQETHTLSESYFERISIGSYSLQTDLFATLSGYNYPNFETEAEMNAYNALLEQYYYVYDQTTMWESLYAFSHERNNSVANITDTTFQIDSIEINKNDIDIKLHGNPEKQSEEHLLKEQKIKIGRDDNLEEYAEHNLANEIAALREEQANFIDSAILATFHAGLYAACAATNPWLVLPATALYALASQDITDTSYGYVMNNVNDEYANFIAVSTAAWLSCAQKSKELEERMGKENYAAYMKKLGNEGYYQISSADGTGKYMIVNAEGINDPKVYAMLTKWQSEKSLTKTMEAFGVEYDFDEDEVVKNLNADKSNYNSDNNDNSGDIALAMMGAKNYSYDPVSLTYTFDGQTYNITYQEYLNAKKILSDLGVELDDLYNAVNTDDYPILPGEE